MDTFRLVAVVALILGNTLSRTCHAYVTITIDNPYYEYASDTESVRVSNYDGNGTDEWIPLGGINYPRTDKWTRTEGEWVLIAVKDRILYEYIELQSSDLFVSIKKNETRPAERYLLLVGPHTDSRRIAGSLNVNRYDKWDVVNKSNRDIDVFISKYTTPEGSDDYFTIHPGSTETWTRRADGLEVMVIKDRQTGQRAACYYNPSRIEWSGF